MLEYGGCCVRDSGNCHARVGCVYVVVIEYRLVTGVMHGLVTYPFHIPIHPNCTLRYHTYMAMTICDHTSTNITNANIYYNLSYAGMILAMGGWGLILYKGKEGEATTPNFF